MSAIGTKQTSPSMQRREFITLLGGAAAAWPLAARAQQSDRMRRIGVLQILAAGDPEWQIRFAAFKQGLQELGWLDGRNFAFEFRNADGRVDRLPALAAELVHANVDVIVTNASTAVEAARNATNTIPIVMASVGDAVGSGYVASLAHPGGNVTGLTLVATEQSTKRLALIKEISPDFTRVAVIWNADADGHRLQLKEMEPAAAVLGIALQSLPIRNGEEIDAGFGAAVQANAQAVVTMDDPLILSHRVRIVALATQHRLPVVGEFRVLSAAGAVMNYGPSQPDMWRRAATYVDKIFKGARPADLPVEQPTKFELVINLKAAKALGLRISPTLLTRAEEVIE
jgi:putative ABC transport system substrate-binding protein